MATAISNMFTFGARHERVPTTEEATEDANSIVADEETGPNEGNVPAAISTGNEESNSNSSVTSADNDSGSELVVETIGSDDEGTTDEHLETQEVEEDDEEAAAGLTATIPRLSTRRTVTLSELEEERELARRRTSACVLLAVFVLFRLWVEALQNGDIFIMMLCLFGTSWTARLIRHNREREEALDERIRAYLENADPNTTEIDRNDLRFLSFQAQLALAMMESQRQMQQGGFGHPDGHSGSDGVSADAKKHWEHFAWKEGLEQSETETAQQSLGLTKKGGYGSVAQNEADKGGLDEDGPHCSICLGEYEEGENLVRLPCGHIYHDDCVSSWTTNHTRCPLCNCDLESVTSDTTHPEDSIV